ncbi:MAG TPA: hypothetical protein DCQ34_10795 [Chitinophagaceae bacterium]|nr:hypothetical protein [Chitinophagaceae bacterium]
MKLICTIGTGQYILRKGKGLSPVIHGKRQNQQKIINTLVTKNLMWIIGCHTWQIYKELPAPSMGSRYLCRLYKQH